MRWKLGTAVSLLCMLLSAQARLIVLTSPEELVTEYQEDNSLSTEKGYPLPTTVLDGQFFQNPVSWLLQRFEELEQQPADDSQMLRQVGCKRFNAAMNEYHQQMNKQSGGGGGMMGMMRDMMLDQQQVLRQRYGEAAAESAEPRPQALPSAGDLLEAFLAGATSSDILDSYAAEDEYYGDDYLYPGEYYADDSEDYYEDFALAGSSSGSASPYVGGSYDLAAENIALGAALQQIMSSMSSIPDLAAGDSSAAVQQQQAAVDEELAAGLADTLAAARGIHDLITGFVNDVFSAIEAAEEEEREAALEAQQAALMFGAHTAATQAQRAQQPTPKLVSSTAVAFAVEGDGAEEDFDLEDMTMAVVVAGCLSAMLVYAVLHQWNELLKATRASRASRPGLHAPLRSSYADDDDSSDGGDEESGAKGKAGGREALVPVVFEHQGKLVRGYMVLGSQQDVGSKGAEAPHKEGYEPTYGSLAAQAAQQEQQQQGGVVIAAHHIHGAQQL